MNSWRSNDSAFGAAIPASRSDALKVAVGFSPRKSAPLTPRRVATLETGSVLFHAPLRGATDFPTMFRGLKPTATFTLSLRDRRNGLRISSPGARRRAPHPRLSHRGPSARSQAGERGEGPRMTSSVNLTR